VGVNQGGREKEDGRRSRGKTLSYRCRQGTSKEHGINPTQHWERGEQGNAAHNQARPGKKGQKKRRPCRERSKRIFYTSAPTTKERKSDISQTGEGGEGKAACQKMVSKIFSGRGFFGNR